MGAQPGSEARQRECSIPREEERVTGRVKGAGTKPTQSPEPTQSLPLPPFTESILSPKSPNRQLRGKCVCFDIVCMCACACVCSSPHTSSPAWPPILSQGEVRLSTDLSGCFLKCWHHEKYASYTKAFSRTFSWTSLVAQRIGIHPPMQQSQVWSCRTPKPVSHNY